MTLDEIKYDPPAAFELIEELKQIILDNIDTIECLDCPCAWCAWWARSAEEHCCAPTADDMRICKCPWVTTKMCEEADQKCKNEVKL